MPPRHAYWTIILEGKPTAFRAHTRDELAPTLRQLQARHPDAVMMWFARGRLWESQEQEREAGARRRQSEKRGPEWRPGGSHRDPRERFKIPRDEKRRRFAARARRDRFEPREAPPHEGEREAPRGPRRDWPREGEGPRGPRPDRRREGEQRPWHRPDQKPGSERPRGPRPDGRREGERRPWHRPDQKPESERPRGPRPDVRRERERPHWPRPDRRREGERPQEPRTERPREGDKPRSPRPDHRRDDDNRFGRRPPGKGSAPDGRGKPGRGGGRGGGARGGRGGPGGRRGPGGGGGRSR